jgi:hypothetical protein
MFQGTTRQVAKVWESVGGRQIGEIPAGRTVTGHAPLSSGYVRLVTPQSGFTKTQWLSGYVEIVVIPPPPPPPPPPSGRTVTHVIDIFSDGSITVDGNSIP